MSGWEEQIVAIVQARRGVNRGSELLIEELIAALRAALSGSTAPLDVERLARALMTAGGIGPWEGERPEVHETYRRRAAKLAAAYAAASPDPAQPGETPGRVRGER
jgi:hypothetical protein